jgi:hypothetical protein
VAEGQGYTQERETWGRGEALDAPDQPADIMVISYTAQVEGVNAPEKALIVTRDNRVERPIAVSAFEAALTDKYGPPSTQFTNLRRYLRTGEQVNREAGVECPEDRVLQSVEVFQNISRGYSNERVGGAVDPACGPLVNIGYFGDRNTGALRTFQITLLDPDVAWENTWRWWSHQRKKEIQARLDALSMIGNDVPDL